MGFYLMKDESKIAKVVARVSAEHGDSAADYYGEFRGGYPWINPKLEDLAKKYDLHWEWEHPGAIGLYE